MLSDLVASEPENLPETISLELHFQTQMPTLHWYGRLRTPYEIAAYMDHLFTRGGYVLVDRNDNPFCRHCSEIVIAQLSRPHKYRSGLLTSRGKRLLKEESQTLTLAE